MMEVQQVREIYFEGRQFIFNHSQLRQSWRPIRQEFPSKGSLFTNIERNVGSLYG